MLFPRAALRETETGYRLFCLVIQTNALVTTGLQIIPCSVRCGDWRAQLATCWCCQCRVWGQSVRPVRPVPGINTCGQPGQSSPALTVREFTVIT